MRPGLEIGFAPLACASLINVFGMEAVDESKWQRWHQQTQVAIAQFCAAHFWGWGVLRLNRHALGWDLLRAPVNLFLAPAWVAAQLLAWLMRALGLTALARVLGRIPPGLATRSHQVLMAHLAEMLRMQECIDNLDAARAAQWRQLLRRYQAQRQATSEILANLMVLGLGWLVFSSFTPGGLGLGVLASDAVHKTTQAQQFWAGPWLGDFWYTLLPPATPFVWRALGVGLALCGIAVTAACAGFVTDPLLYGLRWHQRRLRALTQALYASAERKSGGFQPKAPYWARIFDALDWLRLGG